VEGRSLILRRFLRGTSLFLFAAGILLIAVWIFNFARAFLFETREDEKLREGIRKAEEVKQASSKAAAQPGTLSPQQPLGSAGANANVSVTPRPGDVLGRLEIPRLAHWAMILEGSDDATLKLGVGHVQETALPGQLGNVALVAHRDTFFRPLRHILKNDEIRIITPANTMRYLVESTKVISPDDTDVLDPTSGPVLTLLTCYPFEFVGHAPMRFIVRAVVAPGEQTFSKPLLAIREKQDEQ
jgi:sortase A